MHSGADSKPIYGFIRNAEAGITQTINLEVEKIVYINKNQNNGATSVYQELCDKYSQQLKILEEKQAEIDKEYNYFSSNQARITPDCLIYFKTLQLQKGALDEYIKGIKAEYKEITRDYHVQNTRLHSLNLALIDCNIMLHNNDIQDYEIHKDNFKKTNSLLRKDSSFWTAAELLAYTTVGLLAFVGGLALIPLSLWAGFKLLPLVDYLPSWRSPFAYLGAVVMFTLCGVGAGVNMACFGVDLIKRNVYNPYMMFRAAKKLENHSTTLSSKELPTSVVEYRNQVSAGRG